MKVVLFHSALLAMTAVACNESRPSAIRPPLDNAGSPCATTDPNCRPNPNPTQPGAPDPYPTYPTGTTLPPPPTSTGVPPTEPQCPTDSICKTFSEGERELCRLWASDKTVCDTNRWGKNFYENDIVRARTCTVNGTSASLRATADSAGTELAALSSGSTFLQIAVTQTSCGEGVFFFKAEATVNGAAKTGYVCGKDTKCGP